MARDVRRHRRPGVRPDGRPPLETVLLWIALLSAVGAFMWLFDTWQTWMDRREFEETARREDALRALERMAEEDS